MGTLKRGLMGHGVPLFIFGLRVGVVVAHVTQPRIGLTAPLEGVMNGVSLIALGAAWSALVGSR